MGEQDDPHRVGDFIVDGRIAPGGFGVVFEAHGAEGTPHADSHVALKLEHPPEYAPEQSRMRYDREIALHQRFTHAAVPQLVDHGRWEGRRWLATRYIDGVTLHDHVTANGPQPVAFVRHLALHLAQFLAELHQHGDSHRDLSPHNVILGSRYIDPTRPPALHVIDFGLTHGGFRDESTGLFVVGTPGFLPPERWEIGVVRELGDHCRADLWALGAVLYWAARGVAPIAGKDMAAMRESVERFRVGADVLPSSPPVRNVLVNLMHRDPQNRWRPDQVITELTGRGPQSTTVLGEVPATAPEFGGGTGRPAPVLAVAAVDGDGAVVPDVVEIVPAAAAASGRHRVRVGTPPGQRSPVWLPVLDRGSGPVHGWTARACARLPLGGEARVVDLDVVFHPDLRVELHRVGGPDAATPLETETPQRWPGLLAELPDHWAPLPALDVAVVVETGGGPAAAEARLELVRGIAHWFADRNRTRAAPVRLAVVGHHDHTDDDSPVRTLAFDDPVAIQVELRSWSGVTVPRASRYSTAVEDGLYAAGRLAWEAPERTVVVVGARPPCVVHVGDTEAERCPRRLDAAAELRGLRAAGVDVLGVVDPRPWWSTGRPAGALARARSWWDAVRQGTHPELAEGGADPLRVVEAADPRPSRVPGPLPLALALSRAEAARAGTTRAEAETTRAETSQGTETARGAEA